jgi:hypothetical protein
MKKAHFLFFTKEPDLFTQFSDAAQAIKALRLNQELELAIGNAFVRLSHTKWDLRCGNAFYPNANAAIARNLGINLKNTNLISYLYEFGYTLTHQDSEFH